MALPEIDNVFRVALLWNAGAVVNVMHFRSVGLDEGDIFDALDDAVSSDLWYGNSDSFQVSEVDITKLDGESPTVATSVPPLTSKWTGGWGGEYVPAVSGEIILKTGKRGRSYQGKVKLGPTAEQAIDDGSFVAGQVADTASAWADFLNAMDSAGAPMVVASYLLESAELVTGAIVQPHCRTQRKRQKRLVG